MKAPGIIVEKHGDRLRPASAFDAEMLAETADGTQFELKSLKSRSTPQNRMYWAMLANVVENTALGKLYPTKDKLHDALLRELGFITYDYDMTTRQPYITRDSTRFAAMNADEFRIYFDKAVARLAEAIGCDPLSLTQNQKEVAA
jgi:hypothetical protein